MRRILAGVTLGFMVMACGKGAEAPAPVAPPAAAPAPEPVAAEQPKVETGTVTSAGSGKIIADFEAIGEFNNVGGKYGQWASDKPDPKGMAKVEVVPEGEGTGSAMKLSYDISAREGDKGAYSGMWMDLNGFDASTSQKFVFSAKAAEGAGPKFYVELKCNDNKTVARATASGIGAAWTKVEIPLVEFKEITDWKHLSQTAIVFDHTISTVTKGSYYIDNIRFE